MTIQTFPSTGLKLAAALVAGFIFLNTPTAAEPNQTEESFSAEVTKTFAYKYLKYLPEGYDGKKKFPLLLFLHGAGERGDNLDLVTVHGPPKLIKKGKKFPFIVISPQCPKGSWWDDEGLDALLDEFIGKHAVDESRIYCTGLSMGGYGTWALGGQNASQHWHQYAVAAIAQTPDGSGKNRCGCFTVPRTASCHWMNPSAWWTP